MVEWLRWFFCSTGKVPLVTEDVECFMLDRIFDNWCNDAALCLDRATAAQIDSVAGEFVHAGPFFVLNLANGNPIIVETNTLQADAEGAHYRPAPIFRSVASLGDVADGQARSRCPRRSGRRCATACSACCFRRRVDVVDRGIGEPADLDLGCRLALGFRAGAAGLMGALGEAEVQRILQRFAAERPGMPMPAARARASTSASNAACWWTMSTA